MRAPGGTSVTASRNAGLPAARDSEADHPGHRLELGDELTHPDEVLDHVAGVCFKTGPPGRVGAELEWFVVDAADPDAVVPLRRSQAVLSRSGTALPGGSGLTWEPGGQVELSSRPAPDVSTAHRWLAADAAALAAAFATGGLRLLGAGADPHRVPRRLRRDARYAALDGYFAHRGPDGTVMMNGTAAVQVCLDAGADAADVRRRWHLLHRLGPALVAAFAASPQLAGTPTGWACTRQRIWQALERGAATASTTTGDPVTAWAEHALAAPVLAVRHDDRPWQVDPGTDLRTWIAGTGPAAGLRRPTAGDLRWHLTTLFPPVRPQGHLEVRYLDQQPGRFWAVPLAVVTAVVEDEAAGEAATDAVEAAGVDPAAPDGGAPPWRRAARSAMGDPALAAAATGVLAAAPAALERLGAPALAGLVDEFADRWTRRGRSPADDAPGEEQYVAPVDGYATTTAPAAPAPRPLPCHLEDPA